MCLHFFVSIEMQASVYLSLLKTVLYHVGYILSQSAGVWVWSDRINFSSFSKKARHSIQNLIQLHIAQHQTWPENGQKYQHCRCSYYIYPEKMREQNPKYVLFLKIVRRNFKDVNVSSLLVSLVYKTAHWLQIYEHFRKRKSFPLWRCHSEWSKPHSNILMINCVWDFEISLLLVSHCTKQFVENSGLQGETKKLLLLAIQQVQSKPQKKTSRGNSEQGADSCESRTDDSTWKQWETDNKYTAGDWTGRKHRRNKLMWQRTLN